MLQRGFSVASRVEPLARWTTIHEKGENSPGTIKSTDPNPHGMEAQAAAERNVDLGDSRFLTGAVLLAG
jgi:hypothetical protein